MTFFQETVIQDDNVECTPWKSTSAFSISGALLEGCKEFTRQITSTHNRNARVGPKIVPLDRRQTLRRYSSYGIIINTILKMEGVPYGDMFEVQDEWMIESCSEGEISFTVRFRVHFTKRPMAMVRKVIRDQTRKEVVHWFDMYLKMVQDHIGGETLIVSDTVSFKDRVRRAFQTVIDVFSFGFLSFGLVCILIYYIIHLCNRISFLEAILFDVQKHNQHIIEKLDMVLTEKLVEEPSWVKCLAHFPAGLEAA
jgi:hypothetical protein